MRLGDCKAVLGNWPYKSFFTEEQERGIEMEEGRKKQCLEDTTYFARAWPIQEMLASSFLHSMILFLSHDQPCILIGLLQ